MTMDNQKIFLLPGEAYVSREPVEIATLLGSCVAVCLFNQKLALGGMNHFMLPRAQAGSKPSGKHGDYSTEMLIQAMLSYDDTPGNIKAFMLGGANVTGHLAVGEGIGANNIIVARDIVEKYRIPILHKDIGGQFGRKVHFKTWSGELDVRRIEKSSGLVNLEQKKKALDQEGIKVLIVDDSPTIREILTHAISDSPEMTVVGQAETAYEARELLLEHDPDVICLDIIMPKIDGLTFLKKIMAYKPKPVIIISTVAQKGSKLRQEALASGAVDVIDKEDLGLYKGIDTVKHMLLGKIRLAAVTLVEKRNI